MTGFFALARSRYLNHPLRKKQGTGAGDPRLYGGVGAPSIYYFFYIPHEENAMTIMTNRQPFAPQAFRRHRDFDDFLMKGWEADDVGRQSRHGRRARRRRNARLRNLAIRGVMKALESILSRVRLFIVDDAIED